MHSLRTLAFAAAIAAAAGPAFAQPAVEPAAGGEDARGYLTAFACEALTTPLRVHVDVLDNAEQNLRLKDVFVRQLRARGMEVADASALVMSLEIAVSRQATRLKPGDLVEVRVGRDEPDLGQEGFAKVHMNVWSSSRDSLLAGRRGGVEQEGFDILKLRASLNSRSDGRCLWQGELMLDLEGEDPWRAAAKAAPLLADAVGKAESRKPIRVD